MQSVFFAKALSKHLAFLIPTKFLADLTFGLAQIRVLVLQAHIVDDVLSVD